jgi:monodehydroascorbate reductase (NADH)
MQGMSVKKLTAGPNGQVGAVELSDGTVIDTDLVVVGIGAKPTIGPFVEAGLKSAEGAIEVDGQFQTTSPGVYAIGDVAAFPLKVSVGNHYSHPK